MINMTTLILCIRHTTPSKYDIFFEKKYFPENADISLVSIPFQLHLNTLKNN